MRQLVFRRFSAEAFSRIFGAAPNQTSHPLVDDLIEASGGYFRDLLRMLQELLVRIQTQSRTLPATKAMVADSIQRIREQYLPLSEEDACRMSEIASTRACVPPKASAEEAARLSRLLDLHLVLYYSNGGEWYDVHPLLREEAITITRRLQPRPKTRDTRHTKSRK